MSTVPQIRGVHPSLAIVLDEIAIQIREQQDLANKAAYSAIECWMKIGKLLTEAKLKCSHGSWLSWLAQSTTLSSRQSQRYMQVWSNREIIWARIESGDDFDNLKSAIKSICPPETKKGKHVPGDAFDQEDADQTIDVTEEASDLEELKQKGIEVGTDQVDDPHGAIEAVQIDVLEELADDVKKQLDLPESEFDGPPEEWLNKLPLFHRLKGRPLKLFTADALFWSNTREARVNILNFFRLEQEKAEKDCGMKKCVGRYADECLSSMQLWHPKFWGCCPDCNGTGDGEDVAGLCRRCGGYGYVTV